MPALLVLGLLCLYPSGPALAAQSPLERLSGEFNSLQKNESKAKRRDLWLELENKFAALESKSSGETAAKAAFYRARSRQELGLRSHLASDHKQAARFFGQTADRHGQYATARESLYAQAEVLAYKLGDAHAAGAALKRLIRSYPKSTEAARARQLLDSLGQGEAASQSGTGAASASSGAGGEKTSSVTLKNITWQKKGEKALITLELDQDAAVSHAFLPPDAKARTPGRVYLDLDGAVPGKGVASGLKPKDMVVTRIRAGRAGEGTRVTLECDGVACYAVRSAKNAPGIIEIEVSRKQDIKDGIAVGRKATAASGVARQQPVKKESVIEQLGLAVRTIMIDAGHGGKDPGARHSGIIEKDFTLAMARRVGGLLEKKGFSVLYTRTGNKYISLQDRPDMANNKKADLFISIHVNANPKAGIRGLETYYLDEAKSHDAVTVAARENGVSTKNISDLQFILTDLMLGSKLEESHKLAKCVHSGILAKLKSAKLPAASNGVRSAPFYVLMGARMPAILVEFGYITNAKDAANLKSERFLQSQADGLVEGVLRYKAEVEKIPAP